MKKTKPSSSSFRSADIQHIFRCYTKGHKNLPATSLLQFLRREQMEASTNQDTAESLIDRFEIDETARARRCMTLEGFLRYMESKHCCVFEQNHASVYQDMSQPLCHYFISSSHNTYLTGDQLVGKSHQQAYVRALRKGCRCLEIDCWDGPDTEPIVYHGHTLTSKILFRDVVATVKQHAFEVSPFPVILSLENHCSPKQQEIMAHHLTSILGDLLLTACVDLGSGRQLPSPNDLKHKILIKNKKRGRLQESEERKGGREEERDDSVQVEDDGEGEEGEQEEEQEEEEKVEMKKHPLKTGKRKGREHFVETLWQMPFLCKSKQKTTSVIAQALSDLVVCTKSVKFVSFAYSRERQHFYENTSLAETKARKLAKTAGPEFVQHNIRFISRIYPAGSRTTSSNYNPQEFWNVGAQLVALNFQSFGWPMDLNNGRFQDNGGCGYILKPELLRFAERSFDPNSFQHPTRPAHLLLKVISASNLPGPPTGRRLKPFVRVEVHGVPSDSCRRQSHTDERSSRSARWDAIMNFTINVPELTLIRFCVRHQTGPLTSQLIGQYTLPFSSVKKGYRWVPLLTRQGRSLDSASIFVYLWYC